MVVPLAGTNDNVVELLRWLQSRVAQIVLSVDCTTRLPANLPANVQVVRSPRSRGGQIRHGIKHSTEALIWVVHADSKRLDEPLHYLESLDSQLLCWGRFDVNLPGLGLIARLMNWRSRLTRVCTGDQGMFFHRQALEQIDGYPDQALMEDIEVSNRLKRMPHIQFLSPRQTITSSPNRWFNNGVVSTVLRMWWFRLRYFFGANPKKLFDQYYG